MTHSITATASNPRPSTCCTASGAVDVDVHCAIPGQSGHMLTLPAGSVTVAPRQADGRLAAYGPTADHWITGALLQSLRRLSGEVGGPRMDLDSVLDDILTAAVDAATLTAEQIERVLGGYTDAIAHPVTKADWRHFAARCRGVSGARWNTGWADQLDVRISLAPEMPDSGRAATRGCYTEVVAGADYDYWNMDNEWLVGVRPDGQGFAYAASRTGVLWASGWVRCDGEDAARAFAWDIGKLALERAS